MASLHVPSGASVEIHTAPFKDAKNLEKALMREMAVVGSLNIYSVLMMCSSEAVDAALWPCLIRCTYNKEKITDQTFSKAETRADFYPIAFACAEANIGPLFDGLRSKLSEYGFLTAQAVTAGDQKSVSIMPKDSSLQS